MQFPRNLGNELFLFKRHSQASFSSLGRDFPKGPMMFGFFHADQFPQ